MNAFSNDPDVPSVRRSGAPLVAGRFSIARLGRALAPALVALAIAACGGGGGGSDGGTAAGAAATPTATQSLSGVATYDYVPNSTGALAYGATTARPIRGASVEIVGGDGAVLASTRTDANGAYNALVPRGSAVTVRVKAQMAQTTGSATWDVSVRDNTQSNAIYAIETASFQVAAEAVVRNVRAPSGWSGSAYSATRAAAPFAILDTIYTTQAKVLSVSAATAFPTLQVFWSVNNRAVSGNAALGEIGGTAFVSNASGAAIYLVGRENVDTDEYDAAVIAHEWGHYYQTAFSRDDSPGGAHSAGNLLDRRVAFSEGWGNAWSGIALDRADYTDSFGPAQGLGARIVLSSGAASNAGWYNEASIQSILWNLNRQVGFKPIHDTFTGPFRRGAAVTSIHAFAAAFGTAAPASASVLAGLLGAQAIATSTSDAFGTAESNNGGVASALPLYRGATAGAGTQVCISYQAGTTNRLGNYAYLRFTAPTARTYTIGISGAAGTDPDLAIWGAGVGLAAAAGAAGTSESLNATLPAGDAVIALHDYNNTTASPCFNVTIQ
ncbi:MAG TPA: hypothetical protein VMR43_01965 [Variovorax sp.]|nr:hypothetical protein [Variovorax sp.]